MALRSSFHPQTHHLPMLAYDPTLRRVTDEVAQIEHEPEGAANATVVWDSGLRV